MDDEKRNADRKIEELNRVREVRAGEPIEPGARVGFDRGFDRAQVVEVLVGALKRVDDLDGIEELLDRDEKVAGGGGLPLFSPSGRAAVRQALGLVRPCPECGLGDGLHRGTCSRSAMHGGGDRNPF